MELSREYLRNLLPGRKTDAFFDALYGGAEEGAYDIELSFQHANENEILLFFELHRRPGQCLKCSLTTGLPPVFTRHPVIDAKGMAAKIASEAGFDAYDWNIGATDQVSDDLHVLPFRIVRKA